MMSIGARCVLEQVRDNPGSIPPYAASSAAGEALAEIERLRSALERIASRHHSEKLLWWHQEARDALDGAPSKMSE